MIRELKDSHAYSKVMLALSILTFVSGFAYSIVGEIALPFSAAFCAALFLFENPKGRVFSYIVPLATVAVNVLLNGLYGFISVEIFILSVIIVLAYRYKGTKSECAVYLSIVISLFAVVSLYLGAFKANGSWDINAAFAHYNNLLSELEGQIVKLYASDSSAMQGQVISAEDVDLLFKEVRIQIISFIAGFAFLISGIAIKIFAFTVLRVSKKGILISFAHFIPTNISAYSYALVLILSIFSGTDSTFGIIMLNASNIFMLVFAYLGVRYLTTLAHMTGKRGLIYAILIASLVTVPDVALRLLSLLGAWVTIGTNNTLNMTD